MTGRRAALADLDARLELVEPCSENPDLRMRLEKRVLSFQSRREADVIGVHARDQRRARTPATEVQSGDDTALRVVIHPDPGVFQCIAADYFRRSIRRSVIHDHELKIAEGLRK